MKCRYRLDTCCATRFYGSGFGFGSRKVTKARRKENIKELKCYKELNVLFGGLEASPGTGKKLKTFSVRKTFKYVYNCEIFFIILAQKILNLVLNQDAFYTALGF